MAWELWTYDVWGNETDGWDVNDRTCLDREFALPTDSSDDEIKQALIDAGYLKPGFEIDLDGDDMIVFVNQSNNDFPLFELLLNQEN